MAIMLKAVGILMVISFITGAFISNYAVSKAKDFIGGGGTEIEIKASTPIEELPKDFVLPNIDMGTADYVTIVFPSAKYGEIRIKSQIKKNGC